MANNPRKDKTRYVIWMDSAEEESLIESLKFPNLYAENISDIIEAANKRGDFEKL